MSNVRLRSNCRHPPTLEMADVVFTDGGQTPGGAADGGGLTGTQVRQTRQLLGWSADRFGTECDIAGAVISVFERTGRMKPVTLWLDSESLSADRLLALRTALEAAGIEFIADGGNEPEVKLRMSEP